jgi:hypothetical protein
MVGQAGVVAGVTLTRVRKRDTPSPPRRALLREGFAPAGPGQPGGALGGNPANARCRSRAHGAAGVARRSWATLFVALLRAKPDPRYCGGHAQPPCLIWVNPPCF